MVSLAITWRGGAIYCLGVDLELLAPTANQIIEPTNGAKITKSNHRTLTDWVTVVDFEIETKASIKSTRAASATKSTTR